MIRRSYTAISPTKKPLTLSYAEPQRELRLALTRRRRGSQSSRGISGIKRKALVLLVGSFCLMVWGTFAVLFHARQNKNKQPFQEIRGDSFAVSPLRAPIDYEKYTIRMNTWKREETLRVSLGHHVTCPGVAQIQVVWCIDQGPVPEWLSNWPDDKVVVEVHVVNSLNERFSVQRSPPTAAILSIDDDVLRPCIAYDWAFYKWTKNPDRIVGFDPRAHRVAEDGSWVYEYETPTERANQYSVVLTRCSFLHVDYLHWYTTSPLLLPIREFVDEQFNCEDIGMSLAVSSQTGGQAPLLADFWAVKTAVELDDGSNQKISSGKDHKRLRDRCLDQFAQHLGLKGGESDVRPALKPAFLKSYFEYGGSGSNWNDQHVYTEPDYLRQVREQVERWKANPISLTTELADMRVRASDIAYQAGLVEGTKPWKLRFHHEKQ